jgi:hypothetical protein
MPESHRSLSFSVNAGQLRVNPSHCSLPGEDLGSFRRDAPLSPEGQYDFDMDAEPSPVSQCNFGMDMELSPQGQDDSSMCKPPSPECQDNLGMNAGLSSESQHSFGMDRSPSPSSQRSFGMSASPSPSSKQSFGIGVSPSPSSEHSFGMGVSPSPNSTLILARKRCSLLKSKVRGPTLNRRNRMGPSGWKRRSCQRLKSLELAVCQRKWRKWAFISLRLPRLRNPAAFQQHADVSLIFTDHNKPLTLHIRCSLDMGPASPISRSHGDARLPGQRKPAGPSG